MDHPPQVGRGEAAPVLFGQPMGKVNDELFAIGRALTLEHIFIEAPADALVERGQAGIDGGGDFGASFINEIAQFLKQGIH